MWHIFMSNVILLKNCLKLGGRLKSNTKLKKEIKIINFKIREKKQNRETKITIKFIY